MKQNERAKSRVVTGQPVQEFQPLGFLDLHAKVVNVEKKGQENNKKDTQTQEHTHW